MCEQKGTFFNIYIYIILFFTEDESKSRFRSQLRLNIHIQHNSCFDKNHRSRISHPSLNHSEPKTETDPKVRRRSAAPRSLTGTTWHGFYFDLPCLPFIGCWLRWLQSDPDKDSDLSDQLHYMHLYWVQALKRLRFKCGHYWCRCLQRFHCHSPAKGRWPHKMTLDLHLHSLIKCHTESACYQRVCVYLLRWFVFSNR